MADPAFVSYLEALERHLGARGGVERVLNPGEFALARSWFAAGVPLAAVLAGIDQAGQGGQPVSLLYCRAQVEALAGRVPRRRPRRG